MSSSLGGGARSSSDMELMAASWAGVKVARRLGSWQEKIVVVPYSRFAAKEGVE